MPLLTIYIPTRDRYPLLLRAVHSCLLQSFTDFELLIVDDGSASETRQQVASIAALDSRIRVLQLSESGGACVARNLALAEARGEFITGLDDDDEFLPDRLSSLLAEMQAHPAAAFVCSGYQIMTAKGALLHSNKGAAQISLSDLLYSNIVGNQVLTRTERLRAVGGFDRRMPACQDYDTWIRLLVAFGPARRIGRQNYLIHLDHDKPRISADERRIEGYRLLYQRYQHLMNRAQQRSQQLFMLLYNGRPGLLAIVRQAPLRKLPVALKVYLLRKIGYDI